MTKHPSRWGHLLSGLAGGVIAALVFTVFPAVAANGDPLILSGHNRAGRSTWLASRGPSVMKLNNTAGNPVLDLRNGGGSAPLTVDSTIKVANLNADLLDGKDSTAFLGVEDTAADSELLDGLEANHLVRVGYASTDDASEGNGVKATATIEAPGPGLLVMSGTIDAFSHTSDSYGCRLEVDGTTVTGTEMYSRVHSAGGDHTDNSEENCSTTGVLSVAAGSYDVTLEIVNRDTAAFNDASLWVLYVPFGETGNPPTIP